MPQGSETSPHQFSIFPTEVDQKLRVKLERESALHKPATHVEGMIQDPDEITYEEFEQLYRMGLVVANPDMGTHRLRVAVRPFFSKDAEQIATHGKDSTSISFSYQGEVLPMLYREARVADVDRIRALYKEEAPGSLGEELSSETLTLEKFIALYKAGRITLNHHGNNDRSEIIGDSDGLELTFSVKISSADLLAAHQTRFQKTKNGLQPVEVKRAQSQKQKTVTVTVGGQKAQKIAQYCQEHQIFTDEQILRSRGS